MRDATKWMRRSSCSWRKEGTRRQQKYLTVIKQFSTTRTLLPLILSTEGLLGKNLEKNLRKVTLKDISGTKSLSPVTKSFLPAVDCLGILIPSTRGKHISITLSAAVPHSPSLWLWNLYLAFWAEKSKVAVCDASSTAALYNMLAGFHHTNPMCCLGSFLQLSISHFMYCMFFQTLLPYKHTSYLLQLIHLFSDSETASDCWTLTGQSSLQIFPG